VYARNLRLRLMGEHLDLAGEQIDDLIDPADAVRVIEKSADALDGWYAGGKVGERPPGRLRRHRPERLNALSRLWAQPVYRLIYDPDGRPLRKRMRRAW
jgi:hypothetical protein